MNEMQQEQIDACDRALKSFFAIKQKHWKGVFVAEGAQTYEAAIAEFRSQFEAAWTAFMDANYKAEPGVDQSKGLVPAVRYVLSGEGKRVRALLTLLSFDAFYEGAKDTADYAESFGKACRLGIGLEMIHAYSLVHDDLPCMDDDAVRRGRPAAHVQFDEATAILAGDALLTDGVKVLLASGIPNTTAAVHFVLDAVGSQGMAMGQSLDLIYEREQAPFDAAKAEEVHLLKTGRLFSACLVAGYVAAGKADPKAVQTLAALGLDWGLVFQMEDDLLDPVAEAELGKAEGGSDLKAGKQSFCRDPEAAVQKLEQACARVKVCIEHLGLKDRELSYYLTGMLYRKTEVH
jgi:geranylgeranyl pyrophosphate synthase